MLYHLYNGEQVMEPQPFVGEDICVLTIDSDISKIETVHFNHPFTLPNHPGLYAVRLIDNHAALTQVTALGIPDGVYDVAVVDDLVTVLYRSNNEIRYRKLIIDAQLKECAVVKDGLVGLNNTPIPSLETIDSVRLYQRLNHNGISTQCFALSTKTRIEDAHPLRPRGLTSITEFNQGKIYDIEFLNGIKLYQREHAINIDNGVSFQTKESMLWETDYTYGNNIASLMVHDVGVLFTYAKLDERGYVDATSFKLEYVKGKDVTVNEYNTQTS